MILKAQQGGGILVHAQEGGAVLVGTRQEGSRVVTLTAPHGGVIILEGSNSIDAPPLAPGSSPLQSSTVLPEIVD
jgi:hypothetical protein